MDNLLEIALKTERKLNEQTTEFNILRDRSLIASAYGIALLTAIFTFWNNYGEYSIIVMTVIALVSLISIAILVNGAVSNPLSRGMNSEMIKDLIENPSNDDNSYYLNEISYNLQSFEDNMKMLTRIQSKFNIGIITQVSITVITGVITYLNN